MHKKTILFLPVALLSLGLISQSRQALAETVSSDVSQPTTQVVPEANQEKEKTVQNASAMPAAPATPVVTAAMPTMTKMNFVGRINYVPNAYVKVSAFNGTQNSFIDNMLKHGTLWQVFGYADVNGVRWYNLGGNQWVPGKYLINQGNNQPVVAEPTGSTGEDNSQTNPSQPSGPVITPETFVGKVNPKGAGLINLWAINGNSYSFTGKRVKGGESYKVFSRTSLNGITFYNLGGNQWIDAQYLVKVVPGQGSNNSGMNLNNYYGYGPASHVISHRGQYGPLVEHTFAAYDLAIANGSKFIELDLQRSKSGTLIASHDSSALRITGVNRQYSDMTDAEISQLRTSDGSAILSFQDVVNRYGNSMNYVVQLENIYGGQTSFIQFVQRNQNLDKIILESTSIGVLMQLKQQFPRLKTMYLATSNALFESAVTNKTLDFVAEGYPTMSARHAQLAHAHHKFYTVWTINSADLITNAIQMGVDNYFTNQTDLAMQIETNLR